MTRRDFARLTSGGVLPHAPSAPAYSAESFSGLRAGAATSNITPPLGVSLDGPISQNGPARHVHDELYARCLVLDDGVTRLAIAVCDTTMIWRDIFDEAKTIASQETGMPPDHMLMSATHTHSTPRLGMGQGPLDHWYREFLPRRIADGVIRAFNNLSPARIGWGRADKPEYLFNRRWFVKPGSMPPNPFGETGDRVLMNPPAGSPDLIKPAGPVDPELFVLSIHHDDGRPLALLANFGLHYVGGAGQGDISADYFGMFANRIRELAGSEHPDMPFVGVMSNGTSGDVNAIDFRKERERQPPYTRMREIGFDLAAEAARVSSTAEFRRRIPLAVATSSLRLGVRLPDERLLSWARELWSKATPSQRLTRAEVYARETLELSKYPGELEVPLQALRIGDVGIAAIPCEVFAETGLAIKNESPLRPTFTIELANGYYGYLPTPRQHEAGGYETWPARSSCLEIEAETKIRAEVLRLLKEVATTKA